MLFQIQQMNLGIRMLASLLITTKMVKPRRLSEETKPSKHQYSIVLNNIARWCNFHERTRALAILKNRFVVALTRASSDENTELHDTRANPVICLDPPEIIP